MIKSKFNTERISIRIGLLFSKLGISPNTWTILSIIPAIIGFFALYYYRLEIALSLFLTSGLIDAIDGAVARVMGSVSNLGGFLDGITDRYVEILLYLGLLFYGVGGFWICLLIFGAIMPTYIRAYSDHRKVVTDPEDQKRMGGILERAERLTLIYIGMFLGIFNPGWLTYSVIMAGVLANITALQRLLFVVTYKR